MFHGNCSWESLQKKNPTNQKQFDRLCDCNIVCGYTQQICYMCESRKECQLKGMTLLDRKSPNHFLFLLWQQIINLSRIWLHLIFIIARCSVPSGKRRPWMLFLLMRDLAQWATCNNCGFSLSVLILVRQVIYQQTGYEKTISVTLSSLTSWSFMSL